MCVARHAFIRTYALRRIERVEGVDVLRSVRNSDVCLRIIVGDLANVTLTIFHEQNRDGTM